MNLYKCSCFILFLFIPNLALAQESVLTSAKTYPINLSDAIGILKDSTATLSLEQVRPKYFQKNNKNHFLFPYSDNVYWVKFQLKNTDSSQHNFTLVWSNPLVEQLDFYITGSSGKEFIHQQQKILTKEKEKPLIDQDPRFNFTLKTGESKEIFIKLTSKRGHYGKLILHTEKSYYKSQLNNHSSQSFFNGLVIFRLFLVVILGFFVIKDWPFRLYSLHTVIKTFAFWGYINVAGPWFSDSPEMVAKIDFVFYNSVTLGAGLFVYFTQIKGKLPKIHTLIALFIIALTIFESIIIFIDYQWYWLKLGVYSIIFSAFYFSALYIYCIFKKISIEKYYAIPFILGLISYALLYIRLLGWIELEAVYSIAYFLFFGEIFVFIIFLGGIFRSAQQKLRFNIEQNTRLTELDQLKTSFFANISHEFRTPLTLILANTQDLIKQKPGEKVYQTIHRNANRLLELINQLLDISKLEAGQMAVETQTLNLSKFFRTLISSFTSLAESKGVIFEFSQNKNDVVGVIDTDKVEKIITNLISNAIKFTENKGKVLVEVRYLPKQLEITVADEGIGISANKLEKIFDRFFQVESNSNRKFEGTGIGLALVKELTNILNGTISVESKEGVGTKFSVLLPINYEKWNESLVEAETMINKTSTDTPKINADNTFSDPSNDKILLIVDDNADIRDYLRSIFETEYQIIEAINGKDGISKANEAIPNIIISDLMMPEMDGFEFCKHLKSQENTSHIPIVMLTAKANKESKIESFELGADDYLIKPFNTDEIKVRIKNLAEKQERLRAYFTGTVIDLKPTELKVNSADTVFLQKLKTIIEEKMSNNSFGVEILCRELGMSNSQLLRKLKALTNATPNEFIRDFRLQRAAELLQKKAGTVSEIAFKVGFESLSYFSKVFQEKFGVLPSEYKK
ncbi:MAG: ATP-binding protein [Emticicia sp.]|uniref:ATP-binding protein n=1 Tax=Emticicia sp. TaxID=1930953 RepID=UPI003BA47E83